MTPFVREIGSAKNTGALQRIPIPFCVTGEVLELCYRRPYSDGASRGLALHPEAIFAACRKHVAAEQRGVDQKLRKIWLREADARSHETHKRDSGEPLPVAKDKAARAGTD